VPLIADLLPVRLNMQYQPRTGITSAHWVSGTEGIKGKSIKGEGTKRKSMKCEGKTEGIGINGEMGKAYGGRRGNRVCKKDSGETIECYMKHQRISILRGI